MKMYATYEMVQRAKDLYPKGIKVVSCISNVEFVSSGNFIRHNGSIYCIYPLHMIAVYAWEIKTWATILID